MDFHQGPNRDELNLGNSEDDRGKINRNVDISPTPFALRDGPECVDKCFDQFVGEWYGKIHGDFESVCNQLAHVEPNTELWKLYCCDSTNCGVYTGEKGQSRSLSLTGNIF